MPNIVAPSNAELGFEITASKKSWVLASGHAVSCLSDAVFEDSSFHDNKIEIAGLLSGAGGGNAGIHVEGLRTTINIDVSGSVQGAYGVVLSGDNEVLDNQGHIGGAGTAILASGNAASVENSGSLLASDGLGVDLRGGSGQDQFDNTGTITADTGIITDGAVKLTNGASGEVTVNHDAVRLETAAGVHSKITNLGEMTSTGKHYVILGGNGNETVVNRGTLTGQIDLGGGNDVFDNRGGTVVGFLPGGEAFGGKGNDTYLISSNINLFEYKGEGTDTVKSSISYTLSDNFERLFLTGSADINATGNASANVIHGNKGDNILDGKTGADHLTGSGGADTFVFKTGYGKDTITDFAHGVDHINLSGLTGIQGFADLKSHIEVSGDNLVIHVGTDTLTLDGVHKGDLTSADIIF